MPLIGAIVAWLAAGIAELLGRITRKILIAAAALAAIAAAWGTLSTVIAGAQFALSTVSPTGGIWTMLYAGVPSTFINVIVTSYITVKLSRWIFLNVWFAIDRRWFTLS